MLGLMHGAYGIGGTISPLIATVMVTSGGMTWNRFYLLPLFVAFFNALFAGWSFSGYETKPTLNPTLLTAVGGNDTRSQARDNAASEPADANVTRIQTQSSRSPAAQISNMAHAFRNRVTLLGALFIFAYQGAEVSISGWVLSFLITTRGGNPASVGYVTAGFWGGITLGRFLLSRPAQRIGEKVFVYGAVIGAIVFEGLVWGWGMLSEAGLLWYVTISSSFAVEATDRE